MDALVNRPNKVLETQRALQSDSRFIWQKLPRSGLYVRGYYALFFVGLGASFYGQYKMIKGEKD